MGRRNGKNKAPLAAILGAATYTPRQQSDKENSALRVAIRETEELIKNLEEQKDRENGVDVGFGVVLVVLLEISEHGILVWVT